MEKLKERLANLLSIHSIVTIAATAVFSYLAIIGKITPELFMATYTTIIGFFFGTKKVEK